MQRLTFGSITVDAVSDGVLSCALTGMLPGADPADFRRLGGCDDGETLLLPMLTFVIGSAGKTGSVSKSQLHFELRKGATPVDPLPLLAS